MTMSCNTNSIENFKTVRSVDYSLVWQFHHHHHLSFNREGRWGTTDDFAASFLHFSLFSTVLWTWRTPGPPIPWCCLPTSSSICLSSANYTLTNPQKSVFGKFITHMVSWNDEETIANRRMKNNSTKLGAKETTGEPRNVIIPCSRTKNVIIPFSHKVLIQTGRDHCASLCCGPTGTWSRLACQ